MVTAAHRFVQRACIRKLKTDHSSNEFVVMSSSTGTRFILLFNGAMTPRGRHSPLHPRVSRASIA